MVSVFKSRGLNPLELKVTFRRGCAGQKVTFNITVYPVRKKRSVMSSAVPTLW
jgi:hypothetical protein